MITPDLRSAIYTSLAALSALAVAYGVLTQDTAALWLALAAAVLDTGALLLARRHIPDAPDYAAHAAAARRASSGGRT